MAQSSLPEEFTQPETLVHRLKAQLGHHVLWDSLLIFVPPVLALLYAVFLLAQVAVLSQVVSLVIIVTAFASGFVAVKLRHRPLAPELPAAARLVDAQSGAKDHFLTLATIDPARAPTSMLARLRSETSEFVSRVELKRDFPYRPNRSTYWSMGSSLIAVLLLHFFLPLAEPSLHLTSPQLQLRELAETMAKTPRLKELSQELKVLAAKLENPKIQEQEKQAGVQELEKKIEQQQKREEDKNNRDLLSHASSALQGKEQQPAASGQEQQKDQQKGSGNLQSSLPQKGQGEGKQSQGSGGDNKGEMSARMSKDMQQGNSADGNPKEPGQDKNQQAKGNQPDPNQAGKEQNKNKSDKGQGGLKEGSGKNQASEEPPQGMPPTDRFYKAGEGKDGLKNARYVTVRLPEEAAAEAKGETGATKESKGSRARPQVPVSNTPLPAHLPNAPTEKQQMPIEYRGIIR